jgi:hypothetical protein
MRRFIAIALIAVASVAASGESAEAGPRRGHRGWFPGKGVLRAASAPFRVGQIIFRPHARGLRCGLFGCR